MNFNLNSNKKTDENITISLADFSHKKELTNLWIEAFQDGEDFVKSFLDAYLIPEYNAPVIIDNLTGKIASAFYLIDFELYSNMKPLGNCAYLFAAATKKEYRNKGCMSELIKYSAELYKNRGLKAIFLFPQNQDEYLFDFYAKFGFKSIYCAEKIYSRDFKPDKNLQANDCCLTNLNIAEAETFDDLYKSYVEFTARQNLAPLKDRLFYFKCASSYLDCPEKNAYFAAFENKNNSGKICYIFYKKSADFYYIDDIVFPEHKKNGEIDKTVGLLANYLANSGAGFEMCVPPESFNSQNSKTAMILPLSDDVKEIADNLKSPVYLNMFMNI